MGGKKLTAKERAKVAFDAAVADKVSPIHILRCAKIYCDRTEPQHQKGPDKWLEGRCWEAENVVSGNAGKIEPARNADKPWTNASGRLRVFFDAMSAQGCPDDVLDKLYAGGIELTDINRDRGIPTTVVCKSNFGLQLWYRAASGYSERAGYNRVAYTPAYVEFAEKCIAKRAGRIAVQGRDDVESERRDNAMQRALSEAMDAVGDII